MPQRSAVNNANAYLSAPYGIYATQDGFMALAMMPVPKLGELIGCEALQAYSDPATWFSKRDEIKHLLVAHMQTRTTADWLSILEPQDVEIDQGSLHISADRVTIAMDGDQVTRIDAIGAPAKMHQKPSPEREPVYARATTIQYDVAREILTLIEKAAVTQEGSTVKGERIEYFVQEQRVKASSGSAESGASRVQMVIQPRRATLAPPAANDGQPPAEASPDGAP